MRFHGRTIEENPLQVYASALIFSPNYSMIRSCFRTEEPEWIISKPTLDDAWSPCLLDIKAHDASVNCLAWSPNGNLLASASYDMTIKLWDTMTGQCISTLGGHIKMVLSVAWSRNGEQLVSLSADNTVKIWSLSTGHCDMTFDIYMSSVASVVWAAEGALVASLSSDASIRMWRLTPSATALNFTARTKQLVSVALSPDGIRLGSLARDNPSRRSCTIKIWDTTTSQCLWTIDRNAEAIFWPPDTSTVAVVSRYLVTIWDLTTYQQLSEFQNGSHRVDTMGWSPDGSLVAIGSYDLAVRTYDQTTGAASVLRGHQDRLTCVAWSSKPGRLASVSADGTVMIWDPDGGQSEPPFGGHTGRVYCVFLSPDARRLASVANSSFDEIKIWDVETSRCLFTHSIGLSRLRHAAWSPDSTKLSFLDTATADTKVWDLGMGQCLLRKGTGQAGKFLSWSPDGTLCACTTNDTIEIIDENTGKCGRVIQTRYRNAAAAVWSFDATRLASMYLHLRRYKIAFWDAITGRYISDFEVLDSRLMLDYPLPSFAWSPDGTRIACATTRSRVQIWDTATRQCIMLLHTPRIVFHLAFDTSITQNLHYDRGTLDLDPSAIFSLPTATGQNPPTFSPRHIGYGLDEKLAWITFEGKPVLKLPAQYKPVTPREREISYGISGKIMVIGLASGRILIFKFR